MADILHLVPIRVEPAKVFRAITEQEGLAAWWTTQVKANQEVGSIAEFTFEGGQIVMRMEIAEISAPDRLVWNVAEPSPPEWAGTSVTWTLQSAAEGTHLLFGHRGWKSIEDSFPAINYNWGYYLTSLKEYLESGEGFPHQQ